MTECYLTRHASDKKAPRVGLEPTDPETADQNCSTFFPTFRAPTDSRALKTLRKNLGADWLGGMIVHRGSEITLVSDDDSIWAIPVHRLI